MPQWLSVDDPVTVAAAHAGLFEVTLGCQLADNALSCSLGDSDAFSKIANAQVGVGREADENVRVISHESPLGHLIIVWGQIAAHQTSNA
jgi:hypothetical protein